MFNDINEFDFDQRKCKPVCQLQHTLNDNESEQRQTMLKGLQCFCMSCRFCPVGCELLKTSGMSKDPHVFSNMNHKAKYMIINAYPSLKECSFGCAWSDTTGKILRILFEQNQLRIDDFYITYLMHCHTQQLNKPHQCVNSFLRNEIKIIQPHTIILIGKPTFEFFHPHDLYTSYVGKTINHNISTMFVINHPLEIKSASDLQCQISNLSKQIQKSKIIK